MKNRRIIEEKRRIAEEVEMKRQARERVKNDEKIAIADMPRTK